MRVGSQSLANFFIQKDIEGKGQFEISNMKLQKLMFIGYGWTLAIRDKDIISEGDVFQAWDHGPVLPSIYHEVKLNGRQTIKVLTSYYDEFDDTLIRPQYRDKEIIQVLNKVWDIYKDFSAASLRNLTHEENSPWYNVFSSSDYNIPIKKENIKQYYDEYIRNLFCD